MNLDESQVISMFLFKLNTVDIKEVSKIKIDIQRPNSLKT